MNYQTNNPGWLTRGRVIVVILVIAIGVAGYWAMGMAHRGAAPVPSSAPASRTAEKWLMASNWITSLNSYNHDLAGWFFDTPGAFSKNSATTGYAAEAIVGHTSYAAFAAQLAAGTFPAGVNWVMYDNESWSATPREEAQHPAKYMKLFADLAHAHGLKVLEVPARDLMNVSGADCGAEAGESYDQAFIRCGIPADARYADIYSIQAQADQHSVSAYVSLVTQARDQVKAQDPGIPVMTGLTTDRGDSADVIYNCWNASHSLVSGYWMNTNSSTFSVAEQAFGKIQASGG